MVVWYGRNDEGDGPMGSLEKITFSDMFPVLLIPIKGARNCFRYLYERLRTYSR